jgi:thiol-disulfide isomerase/thioredoxin
MRKAGRMRWLAAIVVVLVVDSAVQPQGPPDKGVEVKVMRYAELGDLVNQQRGKVVVVDFWATFCPPCVQALPHVAQLQKKYAAQGLVVISASLDQIRTDPTKKQAVLQRLQTADAQTLNVILDEDFSFLQQKLRFSGLPCAFVFNRDGQWVQLAEEQFSHALIEQTAIQFLKGP